MAILHKNGVKYFLCRKNQQFLVKFRENSAKISPYFRPCFCQKSVKFRPKKRQKIRKKSLPHGTKLSEKFILRGEKGAKFHALTTEKASEKTKNDRKNRPFFISGAGKMSPKILYIFPSCRTKYGILPSVYHTKRGPFRLFYFLKRWIL